MEEGKEAAGPGGSPAGGRGDDAEASLLRSMDRGSRRHMRLTVHVASAEFAIQVGRGNQTLKWLATAAAQRFQSSLVNHGRLRQREVDGNLCAYVPSGITSPRPDDTENNAGGSASLSPDDRIRDVLQDGDHVYVSLTMDQDVSRDKGAVVTSFQRAAFQTHQPHQRRVRTFIKKVSTRRKQKKASETVTARDVSNLFDDRHIQNVVELRKRCRQEFNRSKIRDLADKNNHEDPELTFEVLSKYFHELEEIYMFFSTLDDGPINSMSVQEFQEFAKHCGMLDRSRRSVGEQDFEEDDSDISSGLNLETLRTIFVACNIEKDAEGRIVHNPNNPTREMLRFEFLEAVVRLALAKYQTDRVMRDAPMSEKVERLCIAYITDYANEICERSLYLRERLSSPEVLSVLHDHLRMLKRVFKAYCKRDNVSLAGNKATAEAAAKFDARRGSTRKLKGLVLSKSKNFHADDDRTISFSEFLLLMSETHCIDERVNKRTLKTIYMQSMQFSYSITQTADEVFRTTTQQVFIEFLEALARVAIAKFGESVDSDGNESLAKIMRRLFEEHIVHMDLKSKKKSRTAEQKEEVTG